MPLCGRVQVLCVDQVVLVVRLYVTDIVTVSNGTPEGVALTGLR